MPWQFADLVDQRSQVFGRLEVSFKVVFDASDLEHYKGT